MEEVQEARLAALRSRLDGIYESLALVERRRADAARAGVAARDRAISFSRVEQLQAELAAAREELDGLHIAIINRGTIEQAKGMLMVRLQLDAEQAFAHLREASNRQNRRLAEVAAEVVRTRAGGASAT